MLDSVGYDFRLNEVPRTRMSIPEVCTMNGWRLSLTTSKNASPSSSTSLMLSLKDSLYVNRLAELSHTWLPSGNNTYERVPGFVSTSLFLAVFASLCLDKASCDG